MLKPRIVPENAGEDLKDNGEPQGDVNGQADRVGTPVLITGDRCTVIQDEKRSLLQDLEHGVGEEHRKLAQQATAHHHDDNDDLEGVGCNPQVMPQE